MYQLIGTQWGAAVETTNPLTFPPGAVPPFLSNTVLETYIQTYFPAGNNFGTGSCISCHSVATLSTNQAVLTNFSFLPGLVNPLLDIGKYLPRSVYEENYGNYEDQKVIDLYQAVLHENDAAPCAEPTNAFGRLAELAADLRAQHPAAAMLSAGMTDDLEPAVAHGATHLRVGRALLGSRPPLR